MRRLLILAACLLSLQACRLSNPDDVLAEHGPGPVLVLEDA